MEKEEEYNVVDNVVVTKTAEKKVKFKDPKKVKAGKLLAEYNKRAKQNQKNVIKEEEEKEEKVIFLKFLLEQFLLYLE